jgi:hypothetical protein
MRTEIGTRSASERPHPALPFAQTACPLSSQTLPDQVALEPRSVEMP